jgi:hypothetical protein
MARHSTLHRHTTTLSLTTPRPTTRPRLSTNLANDINIPIPDSPSLPIPRPTTRAPATRARTNFFLLFSTVREYLYISPVFTSLLTHLGAKQNCVVRNRGRYAGVGTDDDERQGRLLLHALFFPKSLVLRQADSCFSALLFSGLLSSSKNSTELSAIPPTNQPHSEVGSKDLNRHIVEQPAKH